MQIQDLVGRPAGVQGVEIGKLAPSPSTPLRTTLVSCVLHKDSAHSLCGGAEEVAAVLEGVVLIDNQTQVGLVDQRCDIKCLAGLLACQLRACELAKFPVDQRPELLGGVGIALPHRPENSGDVVHQYPHDTTHIHKHDTCMRVRGCQAVAAVVK